MTHRNRPRGARASGSVSTSPHPNWLPPGRQCPWCSGTDTVFVQRGLAGGGNSKDQYTLCNECGRPTFDIVVVGDRQIRLNRFQVGAEYKDSTHRTRYTIYRMLKVGFDEFLLYVRPILADDASNPH